MGFAVEVGEDNIPFLKIGDHKLRLDLEDLDEYYQEIASKELREKPEIVEESLEKLRKLLEGEPELHLPADDDKFLIKFLRPYRYFAEPTFKAIQKFYKFKLKYPKFGQNLTPNVIRHVFDNEVFVFLPTRTPTGSRIMLINVGAKWNPKLVSLYDMFKAMIVGIEIGMMEPKTQVSGVQVIIDMSGFAPRHLMQFSPYLAEIIIYWVQECAPIRLQGIHVINQSFIFNMVYAIFKPFIGEKLKRKLNFHGTNYKKTLCGYVPEECLPEHLGGPLPEYPGDLFSEMLYHYESTFKLYNTYGYFKEKLPTSSTD